MFLAINKNSLGSHNLQPSGKHLTTKATKRYMNKPVPSEMIILFLFGLMSITIFVF